MKKFIVLPLLSLLFLFSCSEPNGTEPGENPEPKLVEYTLSFGDMVEVLATRAGEPDFEDFLVGVQVKGIGGEYAYGIFDSFDGITFNLLENHWYSFDCSLFTPIANFEEGTYPFYLRPVSGSGGTLINEPTGEVVYTEDFKFTDIYNYGLIYDESGRPVGDYSDIKAFAGYTSVTATVGGNITVPMKQFNYGLEVNVNNLEEGEVIFKSYQREIVLDPLNTTYSKMFHFPSSSDDYPWGIEYSVERVLNGETKEIANGKFYIERMKITTININLKDPETPDGEIGFEFGELEMEPGEVINIG